MHAITLKKNSQRPNWQTPANVMCVTPKLHALLLVLKVNHAKTFSVIGTRAHGYLHGKCHGR